MKEKVPGVGGSIGIDRLIAGLEQLGSFKAEGSYLDAEIYCQNADNAIYYQKVAAELRAEGINVEVFPEAKKMGQQYAVTTAKGVKWGVMIGDQEIADGTITLKNLTNREMTSGLSVQKASEMIKAFR